MADMNKLQRLQSYPTIIDYHGLDYEVLGNIWETADVYGNMEYVLYATRSAENSSQPEMSFTMASTLYWDTVPDVIKQTILQAFNGIQFIAQRQLFLDDIFAFKQAVDAFIDESPTQAFATTEGAAAEAQFPAPGLTTDDVLGTNGSPTPTTPAPVPLGSAGNPIVIDEVAAESPDNVIDLTTLDAENLAAEFLASLNSPNKRVKA